MVIHPKALTFILKLVPNVKLMLLRFTLFYQNLKMMKRMILKSLKLRVRVKLRMRMRKKRVKIA